jgi:hypothetical protein
MLANVWISLIPLALGAYNAWLALKKSSARRTSELLAVCGVIYSCLTLSVGIFVACVELFTVPIGNLKSSGPTLAAWNVLITTMHPSSQQTSQPASVSGLAMIRALEAIDESGVDRELWSHLTRQKDLLKREIRLAAAYESEARRVNDNAQVGGAFLGMLFGASAAERGGSYADSLRAGQAAGEFSSNMAQMQIQNWLEQHQAEIGELSAQDSALVSERIQLEQRLRRRYPGSFR